MKKKEFNQRDRVLQYMKDFGSITQLDAYKDIGCQRLSAVIWLLRHEDEIKIDAITENGKNRWEEPTHYFRYYIVGSEFEKKLKEEGII